MSESGKPEKNDALPVADGGTAGPGGDDNALVKIDSPGGRKLVRTLVDGLGAVAGPALRARMEAGRIRKIAEAQAEAIRIRAAAEKEAIEMLGSERGRQIVASVENMTAVRERADERLSFQEVKRQNNIEAVAWQAAQKIPEQVSDEPVHPDWTARFFESVKDVSDETMQSLWSSVLAGEVESPGRTSLRTLDVVKNLSREDAKELERLAQLAFSGGGVFYPHTISRIDEKVSNRVLPYHKKIHMQECGLIHHEAQLITPFRNAKAERFMIGKFLFEIVPAPPRDVFSVNFPTLAITQAGREIARFIPATFPEPWYIRSLAEFLVEHQAILRVFSSLPPIMVNSGWPGALTVNAMPGEESVVKPTASDEELRALLENCPRRIVLK